MDTRKGFSKSPKINDRGYKRFFSNPLASKQLCQSFIQEPWVKRLDFSTLELCKDSFIDPKHKENHSDLIYTCQYQNHPAYLYLLLEFKSSEPRFLGLQLLRYTLNIMDFQVSNKPMPNKLMPIFPIVLYNGESRWKQETTIQSLFDYQSELQPYIPHMSYFLVSVSTYEPSFLEKMNHAVSWMFRLEQSTEQDFITLIRKASESLAYEDESLITALSEWIGLMLHEYYRVDRHVTTQVQSYFQSQEVSMLADTLQRVKDKDIKKGKKEAKKEIIFKMYKTGLPIEKMAELTGIPEQEIRELLELE